MLGFDEEAAGAAVDEEIAKRAEIRAARTAFQTFGSVNRERWATFGSVTWTAGWTKRDATADDHAANVDLTEGETACRHGPQTAPALPRYRCTARAGRIPQRRVPETGV